MVTAGWITTILVSLGVYYLVPTSTGQWVFWGFLVLAAVINTTANFTQIVSFFVSVNSPPAPEPLPEKEELNNIKDAIIAPPNASSFIHSAVQSLNSIHETEWLKTIDALVQYRISYVDKFG